MEADIHTCSRNETDPVQCPQVLYTFVVEQTEGCKKEGRKEGKKEDRNKERGGTVQRDEE